MTTELEQLRKKLDAGELGHIGRSVWHRGLEERAAAIRKDNETAAQAYVRAMTDDDVGKLLFKAYRAAPILKAAAGFDAEGAPGDTPEQEAGLRHIGPAHKEMHSLAVDRQRSLGNTYERAYAHVYSDPDNAALRSKVKAEHLASVAKATGLF